MDRMLPAPTASCTPPEAANATSVPAPSILSALIPRKFSPGLLETAVSPVTRKVGVVAKTPEALEALRP